MACRCRIRSFWGRGLQKSLGPYKVRPRTYRDMNIFTYDGVNKYVCLWICHRDVSREKIRKSSETTAGCSWKTERAAGRGGLMCAILIANYGWVMVPNDLWIVDLCEWTKKIQVLSLHWCGRQAASIWLSNFACCEFFWVCEEASHSVCSTPLYFIYVSILYVQRITKVQQLRISSDSEEHIEKYGCHEFELLFKKALLLWHLDAAAVFCGAPIALDTHCFNFEPIFIPLLWARHKTWINMASDGKIWVGQYLLQLPFKSLNALGKGPFVISKEAGWAERSCISLDASQIAWRFFGEKVE